MASNNEDPSIRRRSMEEKYTSVCKNDDCATIDKMLKMKEIDPNHRIGNKRLLSIAINKIRPNIVKILIDNGANVLDSRMVWYDEEQPLHKTLSKIRTCQLFPEYGGLDNSEKISNLMSILDILIGALEKISMETLITKVFVERDVDEFTPFLYSCGGCQDDIIVRFLHLITDKTRYFFTDIGWFINGNRENPFHFAWGMQPDTVSILIDRLPFSKSLLNWIRYQGHSSPIHLLATQRTSTPHLTQICKLFVDSSADPDMRNENGSTPLHCAVSSCNEGVVETLLRGGCRLDMRNYNGESPLALALNRYQNLRGNNVQVASRILELLLAFGVDLQKELYLYTLEENPDMSINPCLAYRYNTHLTPLELTSVFRRLRRSNHLNSLKRTCRNVIRRHLKPQADQVIKNLTCIPNSLKSYLLVENEPDILTMVDGIMTMKI